MRTVCSEIDWRTKLCLCCTFDHLSLSSLQRQTQNFVEVPKLLPVEAPTHPFETRMQLCCTWCIGGGRLKSQEPCTDLCIVVYSRGSQLCRIVLFISFLMLPRLCASHDVLCSKTDVIFFRSSTPKQSECRCTKVHRRKNCVLVIKTSELILTYCAGTQMHGMYMCVDLSERTNFKNLARKTFDTCCSQGTIV